MSKQSEEKLRRNLQVKFADFTPDDTPKWEELKAQIPRTNNTGVVITTSVVMILIILFLVGIGESVDPNIPFKVNSENDAILLKSEENLPAKQPSKEIQWPDGLPKGALSKASPEIKPDSDEKGNVDQNSIMVASQDSAHLSSSKSNRDLIPLFKLNVQNSPVNDGLSSPGSLNYELTPENVLIEEKTDVSDSVARSGRLKIRFTNTVGLNYLHIRPNTGDNTFVRLPESDFSVSSNRVWFEPRVSLLWPLSQKLKAYTSAIFTYKSYDVSFDIQTYSATGELIADFQTVLEDFNTKNVGVEMGLNYQLDKSFPLSFEVGFGLNRVFIDHLERRDIIGFDQTNYSLRTSMLYYFMETKNVRWISGFTANYALNNKQSMAPLQLTPFSFGITVGAEF